MPLCEIQHSVSVAANQWSDVAPLSTDVYNKTFNDHLMFRDFDFATVIRKRVQLNIRYYIQQPTLKAKGKL